MTVFKKVIFAVTESNDGKQVWEIGAPEAHGWKAELNKDELTDLFLAMAHYFPALGNARRLSLLEQIKRLLDEHQRVYDQLVKSIEVIAERNQDGEGA